MKVNQAPKGRANYVRKGIPKGHTEKQAPKGRANYVRRGMKTRINFQFLLVAAIAILVTAAGLTLLFFSIFKNQVYDDLKSYAHMICELQDLRMTDESSHAKANGVQMIEDEYDPKKDGLRITLVAPSGKVIFDSIADQNNMENHKMRPEILQAMEAGEGMAVRTSHTVSMHTLYYAFRLTDGRILRVGKDSASFYYILKNTVLLVAFLSVITLGACALLSHFLTKRLLFPIERMADHLDGAQEEEIYQEIRPFIQTIKEQHRNLLDHARMRQEFTANVSHELKTPLTAISGYAELIGSGMAGEEDAAHFAKEICQSSGRLLTLINDIIKLSELDELEQDYASRGNMQKEHGYEKEAMDLYQAAQGCLDMMELQARKQEISLILKGEACVIAANKSLIDELLYNLCSNAVRYNNRGGSVTLSVCREAEKVLLSVKDTGIGIPKEHQKRIFERFYRVDKSRSKLSGGTGLGLAIVKHIVTQHDAEMELISEEGKGTEIKIWFSPLKV